MKRYLVTGGCGFIGSHLVDELSKKNEVIILDIGSRKNRPKWDKNVGIVNGDIRDYELVKTLTKNVDCVFHLAAQTRVPDSIKDPHFDVHNNIVGTLNILNAALESDKNNIRIVFSSSGAVYGDPEYTPIDENHPTNPKSPYGVSKLACEKYCRVFHETYGLKTIALRFFNVYGPRSRKGVIYEFISRLLRGKPLEIHGTGKQMRDFVYVKDIVLGNILASKSHAWGKVFNIGTGEGTRITELANLLAEKINGNRKTSVLKYTLPRPGDVKKSFANTERAKRSLAYKSMYPLEKGLDETINWLRKGGL